MKIKRASYNTNIIQDTCGFKEPSERHYQDLGDEVDAAFRKTFLKRGLKVPRISRYHIVTSNELEQKSTT